MWLHTDEEEWLHSGRTGICFGLQHRLSGGWLTSFGEFVHYIPYGFDGPIDALTCAKRFIRESELGVLDLVPFRESRPNKGYEAEADRLLAEGSRPLVQE